MIPLGGLEEVGKNMMAIEYDNDIILIDIGLQFPEEDMLGVDYVIPDVSYLNDKKDRIRGILVTHGHLDHIGAVAHILPKIGNPRIYGSGLTMGLIRKRLEEFALDKGARLHVITRDDKLKLGVFDIEFFGVNHSIPDGLGIVVKSPVGNLVHTGDFKFDFTPACDEPADFGRIARVGKEGVLALFSDSTNATEPGYAISEKVIGETLDKIFSETKGRLIIATFSSLIGRIQQMVDCAVKYDRKIFISGRSMLDNIAMAMELKYLKVPQGLIRQIRSLAPGQVPNHKIIIITTGSQGEELSALTRMALNDHAQIRIKPGDTVVFSSSPIVGNEKAIATVSNNLLRLGARVITDKHMDVHTSGHGKQEDLKLMLNLLKPKYLIPIHGELSMRSAHKDVAMSVGLPEENIFLMDNGDILDITPGHARRSKSKISIANVMIDGLGVGDVGTQVLRERQVMAENGILVVLLRAYSESGKLIGDPDIISRGFIYMRESQEIVNEAKAIVKKAYNTAIANGIKDRKEIKNEIRRTLSRFIQKRIDREPMILSIIFSV